MLVDMKFNEDSNNVLKTGQFLTLSGFDKQFCS